MESPVFISTADLQALIDSHSVQIVDSGMGAKDGHFSKRIPGAKYFNIPDFKCTQSSHSMGFPNLSDFTEYMKRFGLRNNGTTVVVYDQSGVAMAGRAWFMFRHYGYQNVKILDGGLVKWVAEGRTTESGQYQTQVNTNINEADYQFVERQGERAFFPEVLQISQKISRNETDVRVWDPRPAEVFNNGTVDNAVNVFFGTFFNADKTVKTPDAVRKILAERLGNGEIITSCAKGVIACLGYAIATHAGRHARVFTGSLEEWRSLKL
ncbi:hypothetical protein SteCoe_13991 [Stentor coeruleus]|uniref:Rhodanese domain-containing protein n=1 Tax=Stentor coeruleus TaxID=5963 RepID=A0A1R2C704_9CILI|nr:hypothetical protein SteCoe_13991 [Stentor coeruleus]